VGHVFFSGLFAIVVVTGALTWTWVLIRRYDAISQTLQEFFRPAQRVGRRLVAGLREFPAVIWEIANMPIHLPTRSRCP
jgi:hypothetical protein